MCLHWAPALAIIVVSEIGEQWSPQTAPAIHAEIETILIAPSGKAAIQIGIKIEKVPHEVPVAKESTTAMIKIIAGRKILKPWAEPSTTDETNCFACKESVVPFKVHARQRIKIAGTIALKPSGKHSIHSLNERTFLQR